MNLYEQTVELARLRSAADEATERLADIEAQLALTPLGRMRDDVAKTLADLKSKIKDVDGVIRDDLALAVYRETGNKSPAPGISIKLYKVLRYDPDDALVWARRNSPALVIETLDTKGFEKVAVTLGAPVSEEEEPRVTIARDLSALLASDANS